MNLKLLVSGRNIILLFLSLFSTGMYSQSTILKGKVSDGSGIPIIGARIMIVGTTIGTASDVNGEYSFEVPVESNEISFSYVGYLTEKMKLSLQQGVPQTLDVILVEDVLQMEEIVVVGYGTQKKSDLTAAVASVSSKDLEDIPVARVEQALQGRAAGVQVISNTGAPGANVQVKVRGVTSINRSNAIWIVDGVSADPHTISIGDIDHIEVLKDAAAAAIYGANGANGVVLVTTKSGKAGKTSAFLNINYSIQSVPKSSFMDVASGPQFGKMYTEYEALLRKRTFYFSDPDTLSTYDYQDMIFQKAPMQSYEFGVSGGSERGTYYASVGYTKQEGILKNSDYEKVNVRLKSDAKLNKWISFGENISLTWQKYSGYEEWQLVNEYHTPILGAILYHPYVPPYVDTLGNPATSKTDGTNWSFSPLGVSGNPLSSIELLDKKREEILTKTTVFLRIEPLKGLYFESRFTANVDYNNFYQFSKKFYITPSNYNANSKISRNYGDSFGWGWQNTLTFDRVFFDNHNLKLMAGYESGEWFSKSIGATRWDLINESEEMRYFDASQNDTLVSQIPDGGASEGAGYSYFGRLNYDYKGIFLGQFIIRRDGDAKFGPKNKFGTFPSWSVGLKFSEFNFIKTSLPFLSFGKIRYGWGKIGNNVVPSYVPFSTVGMPSVYSYSFDNTPVSSIGAARNKLSNPSIAWESMVTSNFGIDLSLFSNKLSLVFEVFKRYNEGMIMQPDIPGSAGWIVRNPYQEGGTSLPYANVGTMINNGIELSAGWKETRGKFNYSIDLNYTYVTTHAEDLPGGDTLYRGQAKGISGYLTLTTPNGPLSEYYGYITEGLFQPEDAEIINDKSVVTNQPYVEDPETHERSYAQPHAQPGDFRFKDVNQDGKLSVKDMAPIGNPIPKHLLGLNINLNYSMFDLNVFLQGAMGYKIFNAVKFYLYNMDGSYNWSADYVENHYREDIYDRSGETLLFPANHDGEYPRLDPRNMNQNFSRISDFYMEDGSYLRIKNIQLGLTLPNKWSKVAGIDKFRLYTGVTNLFTFTKYSGYDPEVGSPEDQNLVQGLDKAAYPRARMVNFGVNITF